MQQVELDEILEEFEKLVLIDLTLKAKRAAEPLKIRTREGTIEIKFSDAT